MTQKRLDGKVALITGAAQGIGKEIAVVFAKEGAIVLFSDVNDAVGAAVAKEIGGNAEYLHQDVSDEQGWQKIMAYILEKHGKLDVLVNNAGISGFEGNLGPQDPEHVSLDSWRAVNAVNSDGTFLGCKYAIGAMKNSHGCIINMSSRSGIVGIPGAAPYAASKAAIRNHTKTVALYCCEKGYSIRCNSIHPAAIRTPLWDSMLGSGAAKEANLAAVTDAIPMKKMGDPGDVAYAALFLACEESKYITGIELTIDGGILAGANASPKKSD